MLHIPGQCMANQVRRQPLANVCLKHHSHHQTPILNRSLGVALLWPETDANFLQSSTVNRVIGFGQVARSSWRVVKQVRRSMALREPKGRSSCSAQYFASPSHVRPRSLSRSRLSKSLTHSSLAQFGKRVRLNDHNESLRGAHGEKFCAESRTVAMHPSSA